MVGEQRSSTRVWPARSELPRVLVESRDDERRRSMEAALRSHRYEVISCAGPDSEHDRPCPAVNGARCHVAAHADVVICDFDASDLHSRSLPAAVSHELRTGASVIVQVESPVADRYRDELEGCRVLLHPVADEELLAAVEAALDDLADTPPPRPIRPRRRPW